MLSHRITDSNAEEEFKYDSEIYLSLFKLVFKKHFPVSTWTK